MRFAPQRRALFRHLTFQKSTEHGVLCHFLLPNPPTPALAKAGTAPGTTAGVELFSLSMLCTFHAPPRPEHSTRQTRLQLVHRPGATEATAIIVTCHGPLIPQQSRYPAAADPLQVQQAPEAVPMSFYGGSRLSFARPQTSLQLGHRPGVPTGHSCHSNLGYRPRQTLAFQQVSEAVPMSFIWRFKAAVCQASNVLAARSPPRSH